MKILLFYGLLNIIMIFCFMWMQSYFQADLDLDPSKIPAGDDSLFAFAVMLLPLTLLLEDFGLRLMPWIIIHDILRLHTIEVKPASNQKDWEISDKRKWRVWLYHNTFSFYIVVSALWHSFLHQSNVVAANPLGRFLYFGIQLTSGLILAWIFIRKGFWESYTLHLSWDLLLLGFAALLTLLSL